MILYNNNAYDLISFRLSCMLLVAFLVVIYKVHLRSSE